MGKLEDLAERIHDPVIKQEFLERISRMTPEEYKETEAVVPGVFNALYQGKHMGPGKTVIDPPRELADNRADGAANTRRRKQAERNAARQAARNAVA